jgi:hypothetical protein
MWEETMAKNPNPARITDASWWLMEQLLALQPGTRRGGIYADKSGYHNTRAANEARWPGDYSIKDPPDRGGPPDKAAAYDWTFPDAQAGHYETISRYARRLLAASRDTHDPRLKGWREWFGQTDDDSRVEGWDLRYRQASTSNSSHLWHIHVSENRNRVGDYDNKRALLSVLKGETVAEWLSGAEAGVRVFTPGDGPMYGIRPDGGLMWYRHLDPLGGRAHWANGRGVKVGSGWGTFERVLASRSGTIYAIQPDGDLLWYRHLDPLTGAARWANGHGLKIGSGWDGFTQVTASNGGVIYAIRPDGDLMWYRHLDPLGGAARWADGHGVKIGSGWNHFSG